VCVQPGKGFAAVAGLLVLLLLLVEVLLGRPIKGEIRSSNELP